MRQHNPNTDGRNCWKPRDRARIRARHAIRERVANGGTTRREEVRNDDDGSTTREDKKEETECFEERVKELLFRIIENDRSFFSLTYLEDNRSLLSSPLPTSHVWEADEPKDMDSQTTQKLRGEARLLSWYGFEGLDRLKSLLFELESFTVLDYAIIFQRYHIVGSFMLAGLNPCLRGVLRDERVGMEWQEELHNVGYTVLQRFFEPIPLTLSSYIAKRSFDTRMAAWQNQTKQDSCDLCSRKDVPVSLQSSFAPSCAHIICEPCFWMSTLVRLDQVDGDVVSCPCCCPPISATDRTVYLEPCSSDKTERMKKLEETRSKFLALPKDGDELKRTDRKQKKKSKNGRFILSSTWHEAVKPLLGATQEIRTDRFFNFVEAGSFHQVLGFLDCGVDPELKNQYGQTPLYIAAWQGHEKIVRILLANGSDPQSIANGGSSPIDAATANGFDGVVDLLRQFGGSRSSRRSAPLSLPDTPLQFKEIVPRSLEHPGAGSYLIDGILNEESTKSLVDLRALLPVAEGKKKVGPCSERRYFCDIEGFVTSLLTAALCKVDFAGDEAILFSPYMRYLCYREDGLALAPHVDLFRAVDQTGKRSTHTFILFVTDCAEGGSTTLLDGLTGAGRNKKLYRVNPVRGRLLLFPHACPHEGEEVVDVPKLLVRGDVFLPDVGHL